MVARYPQYPPIVSMMKTLRFVPAADCLILSHVLKDTKQMLTHLVVDLHVCELYIIFYSMWFLTVVIVLRAVSAPMLKSDPGTLLDTVAGITTRGIHNSSYFSLAVTNSKPPTKA